MSDKKSKGISGEFNAEVSEQVVAEKGNTALTLKPKEYLVLFEPEVAPCGHIGVQRDLPSNPAHQSEERPIDVHGHDFSLEDHEHDYTIQMKVEDAPSEKGLEGGRISRLTLIKGERDPENIKAHFDDGEWKKPPSTFLEKQIVMEKRDEYKEEEHEQKKHDHNQSRDHGMDI